MRIIDDFMKRIIVYMLFALSAPFLAAYTFTFDNFKSKVSPLSDMESLSVFERLKLLGWDKLEVKSAIYNSGHLAIDDLCINVDELLLLEKVALEGLEYSQIPSRIGENKYAREILYSPQGIFEKTSSDENFGRSIRFSRQSAYPQILCFAPDYYDRISSFLNSYVKYLLSRGDLISIQVYLDSLEDLKSAFADLAKTRKYENKNDVYEINIELHENGLLIKNAVFQMRNLQFFMYAATEKCSDEVVFSKFPVYDVFDEAQSNLSNGDGSYGFVIEQGRIVLNDDWAKYLYGNKKMEPFMAARITRINDVDIAEVKNLNQFLSKFAKLKIDFQSEAGDISQEFFKMGNLQRSLILDAKKISMPSDLLFK